MRKLLVTTAIVATCATASLAGGNNNGPVFGGGSANATAGASAAAIAGATAVSANHNSNVNRNTNRNTNVNSAHQGQLQGQAQGQMQRAQSNNYNSINHEAAAPSAVAGTVAPSGNCGVGLGLGGSQTWGAASLGVTWQNVPCVVRMEAAQLMSMGLRDAAILHLANYHRRMGQTLENAGVVAQKTAPAATSSRSAEPVAVAYTSCQMKGGKLHVGVARGASEDTRARAVQQCRAAIR